MYGADAHHRLDRPGRPEQVPEHRLRRGDGQLVRVPAEDLLDRLRLREIALRRRRSVRVDVADPLGRDAGAGQRRPHHLGDPDRGGIGLSHVVSVVRGPVAEHLRVHPSPSRLGVLEVLEQEDARALAHDEPRARGVERPRGARRIVLLGDETAHRRESGEDHGMHAGLGAARQDDVGVTAADQLGALADRV